MKAHSKVLIGKKAKVKRKKAKVKGRFTLTFFLLPSYFLLLSRVGGAPRPLALQHAVARAWAARYPPLDSLDRDRRRVGGRSA